MDWLINCIIHILFQGQCDPALGSEFVFSVHEKELIIGEIFVRIYNDQPTFPLEVSPRTPSSPVMRGLKLHMQMYNFFLQFYICEVEITQIIPYCGDFQLYKYFLFCDLSESQGFHHRPVGLSGIASAIFTFLDGTECAGLHQRHAAAGRTVNTCRVGPWGTQECHQK